MKHLVETSELTQEEFLDTLALASELKAQKNHPKPLAGKSLALLFMNPSLRTRVSFIRAMEQLGGSTISMDGGKDSWKMVTGDNIVMNQDGVEHIKDGIPVLGRYCDFLGMRAFGDMKDFDVDRHDEFIRSVASYSTIPFVNLESAMAHPCQGFADVLTIQELHRKKPKIVLSWAPHPKSLPTAVPNSFLLASSRMGWDVTLLRPEGFELPQEITDQVKNFSNQHQGTFHETDDRSKAFEGADVVYAKSWGCIQDYGQPEREKQRKQTLQSWTLTKEDMMTTNDGIFMHCLPVRRNVEVSDEVLDSRSSRVTDEAENRLHVQKAILLQLTKWNEPRSTL